MPYELHLNLRQRATLTAAISFWKKQEVKDKVVELLKSCDKFKIYKAREKWDEFTKMVIDEWNRDLLPQSLDFELIDVVKMIGEKIFNWLQYIKHEYKVKDVTYWIDKIHWTPYGTVDEVKTYKSYWLNNSNLNITNMFKFACTHMIEEDINDLWKKIPHDLQLYLYDISLRRFDQHILAYWICRGNGDIPNLISYFQSALDLFNRQYTLEFSFIYDLNCSTEENMLRLSAHQGLFLAVKYFWEKLTDQERNESIVKCARIAVMCCYHFHEEHRCIEHYKIDQYIEICIFLMNQMTDSHKKTFFNELLNTLELRFNGSVERDTRDELLRMFLSRWPWQELYIPILEDMLKLLDDNSKMYCTFLDSITKKISEDLSSGYPREMSKHRNLLRQVWCLLSATVKQELAEIGSMHHFIDDFIDMQDLDCLRLIFNDPDIATVRDQYIHFGENSYRELIENDELEILDQFLREIFQTKEEITKFKKSIDLLCRFITDHNYQLAEKFLDWVYSSPEEKELRKRMEFNKIVDELIFEYDFKMLEKFSNWTFNTEDEKKPFKVRLKNDRHTMEWITSKWRECHGDINKAKQECSEFLQWLLESEDEIVRFKRELFGTERNQINLYVLSKIKRKGILEELFTWCMTPDEDVQRIELGLSQRNWEH